MPFRVPLLVIALVVVANTACANPANRAATAQHFGDLITEKLQTCLLCHVSEHGENASSLEDFPHNSFGNALRLTGERLLDEGEDDGIVARLKIIADDDTDGDGFANVLEILLGSLPGDPDDIPGPDALAREAEFLTAYQARLRDYQWRPFHPVQRPQVPAISGSWAKNPIDSFIADKHDQKRLAPMDEASPEQLLRRVYLDLIGLSPTADETERFVMEYPKNPRAYDHVVDRLLSDPAYGERWGRHWMDVWRYSDWAGYKDALRESQRHIWHWRDWIVESLNGDMGYDQMVMRMLAADEMLLDDSQLRATGYLARNYFTNRDQWMDNVVKHTSQAFLGVTLGCAKCHDHMTDPFEQTEYYGLRAVFESHDIRTDRVPGELDLSKNGIPRAFDRSLTAKTYLFERGDERYPVKDEVIPPGVPDVLGGTFTAHPVSLSGDAIRPDGRSFVMADLREAARAKIVAAKNDGERSAAEVALEALEAEFDLEAREAAGLSTDSEEWKEAAKHIVALQRAAEKIEADWLLADSTRQLETSKKRLTALDESKDTAAISKAKKALDAAEKSLKAATDRADKAATALESELTVEFKRREQKTYPEQSSGRRLAFAKWLTDPQNPLAARVAVNHLWARHFGRGIVPTTNDFGASGRPPTHPELLDWLAAELMQQDWSMKAIHRLIVTSATYRMDSSSSMSNHSIDPDNEFYWQSPDRRMEGEIVRDNLLHVAGRLDATLGGPDIDNQLAQQSQRRSIYLRHAHEKLVEFVQIFDGPSVTECYQRETSIQPHQALALVNSQLSLAAAKSITKSLEPLTADDDELFIQKAFLHILGRNPTKEETELCHRFLQESNEPRQNLVLVLLNHNDFVAIR